MIHYLLLESSHLLEFLVFGLLGDQAQFSRERPQVSQEVDVLIDLSLLMILI